jgi:hypothetical protein
MTKTTDRTNASGALFAAHAVALTFLTEQLRATQPSPTTHLRTFGNIFSGCFLPEDAGAIKLAYTDQAKKFGVADTDWAMAHMAAFQKQVSMSPEPAKIAYAPFHDRVLQVLADIKVEPDAIYQLMTVSQIIDQTHIPLKAIPTIVGLFEYKAGDLECADTTWATMTIRGLNGRLSEAAVRGNGSDASTTERAEPHAPEQPDDPSWAAS